MKYLELAGLIKATQCSNRVSLLSPVTADSGFFAYASQLLFVVKDNSISLQEGIETEYLKLQTHIRLNPIDDSKTFCDGLYNIITYKGSEEHSGADAFVHLCEVYAVNSKELAFKDFFYSLIDLFQLPTEQGYKNALGLYGELKFLHMAWKKWGYDLSSLWHKGGAFSQYDFSSNDMHIEVKTSSSQQIGVVIKHNQLFNDNTCFLAVISCVQDETGESIDDLICTIRDENVLNGLNFEIILAGELARVSPLDVKNLKYRCSSLNIYDSKSINPFKEIPEFVSKLTYFLDVSEMEEMSSNEVSIVLGQFSEVNQLGC